MYRIHIVDDEASERENIEFLIQEYGIPLSVSQSANGRDAWAYIQDNEIDILHTDIKMPFMDGLELAQLVHENYPKIKIIIFSAYGEFSYAKKAMEASALNYLLKPIDVEEFVKVMSDVIGQCERERVSSTQRQNMLNWQPVEAGRVVKKTIQIISEHFNQDLSLDYLAEQVAVAPAYLSVLFKRETGSTLIRFLTDYRMDHARHMLADDRLKIWQIAQSCGYENVSYFNRVFKQHFGVTPNEFRENIHD